MIQFFDDPLIESLLAARDEQKTITEVKYTYGSLLEDDLSEINRLNTIHEGIKDYYSEVTDGLKLYWQGDHELMGGNIQLAKSKYLLADPKDNGIYYDETDKDSDLQYFHPLDFPSPESYVGFIMKPETIYKSVYYMSASDNALKNLDLDFHGYTQMAFEARIFNHWQAVLLFYMNGKGEGESETETFKKEMPKIFPDWTWEDFISKFENLRLSNKA